VHVSQKPVELMRWCIDKARPLTDLPVFDPYMGSGSTGVACSTMNIPFVGIEIDPDHFNTACERIENASRQGILTA
jgi:site-specific DNA-methyltransferase (adenine-specific)/modification methylase